MFWDPRRLCVVSFLLALVPVTCPNVALVELKYPLPLRFRGESENDCGGGGNGDGCGFTSLFAFNAARNEFNRSWKI